MRRQPRQIYTSMRSQDGVRGESPSPVRIVVALLVALVLAVIVVAVLSLA